MAIDKTVLPARINAFIAGKLQGKDPATALAVYSSQDPYFNGLGKFIRNPSCWLNGVKNISCFSPAQMSGANWWQRGGTLITRKHVLFAAHFAPAVITGGTPLIFVADDNTVIRRNIVQYGTIPWGADVAIALLDSDVPANIQIAKVLPKNYADYLNSDATTPAYCVGLDQQEKALVKLGTIGSGSVFNYNGQQIMYNVFGVHETWAAHQYQSFNEAIIVGDSGNPVFLILDNELVVMTTWLSPTGGAFISAPSVYDTTNALIESLSPGEGYALTDVDLAAAYENMPKVYFNPSVSDSLLDAANWYQDAEHTIPATVVPGNNKEIPILPWNKSANRTLNGSGAAAVMYW